MKVCLQFFRHSVYQVQPLEFMHHLHCIIISFIQEWLISKTIAIQLLPTELHWYSFYKVKLLIPCYKIQQILIHHYIQPPNRFTTNLETNSFCVCVCGVHNILSCCSVCLAGPNLSMPIVASLLLSFFRSFFFFTPFFLKVLDNLGIPFYILGLFS